jgi:hypothetical protein
VETVERTTIDAHHAEDSRAGGGRVLSLQIAFAARCEDPTSK